MITTGELINNRYLLETELGRGGMGVIYRARDTLLERPVAVKVLGNAKLGSQGRARLLREARAAAQLNHPNIVAVYDAGEVEDLPYLVMELVEGDTLYDKRPQTNAEMIEVARQICRALGHAHHHGVIHRDLKPENVLIAPDGTAKLMDFGLARSVASRMSLEGAIVGTVFYLAPEQALGKELDGRADLYSLGVMLYELCTGQLPFSGDDPFAVITQHLHTPPVPPRAKNETIPPALDALIQRLLSKSPHERPASAEDVLHQLDEIDRAPAAPVDEAAPALSLLERIVRGRILGRERELSDAGMLWERARRGEGQLLLVSGEPGVGKTRLVREIVTRAEVSGSPALTGECYAEGGAPFAPFAQVVRAALQDGARPDSLPDFVLADLLLLAPDLRLIHPNVQSNPSLDPHSDQARLFENVTTFCALVCQRSPLLLVLEDVHWADSGTLSLLHHLARRARGMPVLLVATYREVELDQTLPLQALLHDLNRERLGSRIKLERLDKAATLAMLSALFAQEITSEFLEPIYRETEGNPFFIEEVCKALVDSGKLSYSGGRWHRPDMRELEIPQSVRLAIQSRLGNLPSSVQEVLSFASILGRQFDFELLAQASARPEDELIDALETSIAAQLVEEASSARGGTYRYTHALIPPILSEALSIPRRRRYHRQVLAALEALRPGDLESLAYHALESGDLVKGATYSLHAARKAYKLYALEEAKRHAFHAHEAIEELDDPQLVVEIHELLGDIHLLRGAYGVCQEAYLWAIKLNQEELKRPVLNSKLGLAYTWSGDARGLEYLRAAIDQADPQTQATVRANAIAGIGRYHHYSGQLNHAIEHLEQAYAIAETSQDPLLLTNIYSFLAGAYQHLAEYERSIEWSRRLMELGEQLKSPLAVAIGNEFLAEDFFGLGRWQEAIRHAVQDRDIGVKIGALDRVAWGELSIAYANYGLGDLSKAAPAAQSSLELAEQNDEIRLAILAGSIVSLIQMDMGQVEAALEAARLSHQRGVELGQVFMFAAGNHALAYYHGMQGNWEEARQLMEAVEAIRSSTENRVVPILYYGVYALSALEMGDLEAAERIVQNNLTLTRQTGTTHYEAETACLLALIRAAQGMQEEAARLFEQAIAILESLGSRLELGKTLFYQARAQSAWGEAQPARRSLQRAQELFEACHAGFWVDKARERLGEI